MKILSIAGATLEGYEIICLHCRSKLEYTQEDVIKIVCGMQPQYAAEVPPNVAYKDIIVCPVCRRWVDV